MKNYSLKKYTSPDISVLIFVSYHKIMAYPMYKKQNNGRNDPYSSHQVDFKHFYPKRSPVRLRLHFIRDKCKQFITYLLCLYKEGSYFYSTSIY